MPMNEDGGEDEAEEDKDGLGAGGRILSIAAFTSTSSGTERLRGTNCSIESFSSSSISSSLLFRLSLLSFISLSSEGEGPRWEEEEDDDNDDDGCEGVLL